MRKKTSFKLAVWAILFSFIINFSLPPKLTFAQTAPEPILNLPAPGSMVPVSNKFLPTMINGVMIDPQNPLQFDFIVDTGDSDLKDESLRTEANKLIKYFMAALTVPEQELWVNLSPYEKDRIIPQNFGLTEMGRDLLAQDYILKQLTASLMYPEKEIGKDFWNRVYKKAQERFGTTDIPLNTFNKIWIVPDKAVVYEFENSAFVLNSHLKVMLEEDYTALQHNLNNPSMGMGNLGAQDAQSVSGVSSDVVREVLIPEIEREVNEGKNFANLRQIYNSMILATWFKQTLKDSILGQVYVNQGKVKGIDIEDKTVKEKIYRQYLDAFKKGVYNYIKEDYDASTQTLIPRKYFSGGADFASLASKAEIINPLTAEPKDSASLAQQIEENPHRYKISATLSKVDHAMVVEAPQIDSIIRASENQGKTERLSGEDIRNVRDYFLSDIRLQFNPAELNVNNTVAAALKPDPGAKPSINLILYENTTDATPVLIKESADTYQLSHFIKPQSGPSGLYLSRELYNEAKEAGPRIAQALVARELIRHTQPSALIKFDKVTEQSGLKEFLQKQIASSAPRATSDLASLSNTYTLGHADWRVVKLPVSTAAPIELRVSKGSSGQLLVHRGMDPAIEIDGTPKRIEYSRNGQNVRVEIAKTDTGFSIREIPRITILMVDDSPGILRSASLALSNQFRILTARSGNEALTLFKAEKPDAVVTDLQMPGMDGTALSKAIAEIDSSVPIHIVTGSNEKDETIRERSVPNVAAIFRKPAYIDPLRETLSKTFPVINADRAMLSYTGMGEDEVAAQITRYREEHSVTEVESEDKDILQRATEKARNFVTTEEINGYNIISSKEITFGIAIFENKLYIEEPLLNNLKKIDAQLKTDALTRALVRTFKRGGMHRKIDSEIQYASTAVPDFMNNIFQKKGERLSSQLDHIKNALTGNHESKDLKTILNLDPNTKFIYLDPDGEELSQEEGEKQRRKETNEIYDESRNAILDIIVNSLNGDINPKRQLRLKDRDDPSITDKKVVNIGMLAFAANPITMAHYSVALLKAWAISKADKFFPDLTKGDFRKPALERSFDLRFTMLTDIIKTISGDIMSVKPKRLFDNGINGEEKVEQVVELNHTADVIEIKYVAGEDHFFSFARELDFDQDSAGEILLGTTVDKKNQKKLINTVKNKDFQKVLKSIIERDPTAVPANVLDFLRSLTDTDNLNNIIIPGVNLPTLVAGKEIKFIELTPGNFKDFEYYVKLDGYHELLQQLLAQEHDSIPQEHRALIAKLSETENPEARMEILRKGQKSSVKSGIMLPTLDTMGKLYLVQDQLRKRYPGKTINIHMVKISRGNTNPRDKLRDNLIMRQDNKHRVNVITVQGLSFDVSSTNLRKALEKYVRNRTFDLNAFTTMPLQGLQRILAPDQAARNYLYDLVAQNDPIFSNSMHVIFPVNPQELESKHKQALSNLIAAAGGDIAIEESVSGDVSEINVWNNIVEKKSKVNPALSIKYQVQYFGKENKMIWKVLSINHREQTEETIKQKLINAITEYIKEYNPPTPDVKTEIQLPSVTQSIEETLQDGGEVVDEDTLGDSLGATPSSVEAVSAPQSIEEARARIRELLKENISFTDPEDLEILQSDSSAPKTLSAPLKRLTDRLYLALDFPNELDDESKATLIQTVKELDSILDRLEDFAMISTEDLVNKINSGEIPKGSIIKATYKIRGGSNDPVTRSGTVIETDENGVIFQPQGEKDPILIFIKGRALRDADAQPYSRPLTDREQYLWGLRPGENGTFEFETAPQPEGSTGGLPLFEQQDRRDPAMKTEEIRGIKPPGGIDLNPEMLNLQIKRDGNGVPLPIQMQPIKNMRIDGFMPVIIDIRPAVNLPLILGVNAPKKEDEQKQNDISFNLSKSTAREETFELQETAH